MSATLAAGSTGPAVPNTLTQLIGNRISIQTWHDDGTVSLRFKFVDGPTVPGASRVSLDVALATAALEGFPVMTHKPSWMVTP